MSEITTIKQVQDAINKLFDREDKRDKKYWKAVEEDADEFDRLISLRREFYTSCNEKRSRKGCRDTKV